MDFRTNNIIEEYLTQQLDIFTVDDFYRYLKSKGAKITKTDARDILQVSEYAFSLVNNEYVTKAGVFTGRWFSFKPSREEVEKGYILIGHRCIPFVNPELPPDAISIMSCGKNIESEAHTFSMNLAMDTFALYGEGYILPYIFNDKNNTSIPLSSVQYSMPQEICLTCWPLKEINGGQDFKYGDRILCRALNWCDGVVEMNVQSSCLSEYVISDEAVQREEWYTHFENGLLESFDKHGPASSIEEQLSYLFLENQEELCIRCCGSTEEFLAHTTKIGFEPYGVETRIWRKGESVPYIGKWNGLGIDRGTLLSDMALTLTPRVIDAILEDRIYDSRNKKSKSDQDESESFDDVLQKIFPNMAMISSAERRLVLLNIEKRNDILKKMYNQFSDYPIAQLRKRILALFTNVSKLFCEIGGSGVAADNFPQQELVILSQLYSHVVRLLEEVENVYMRPHFPTDDVSLSLDGMEETFEEISGILFSALESNRFKGFEIVKTE
ncbi:hypothetical protein SAMN04487977_102155 [Treponema bryantii]|uniref:Uncharacterized protein n=1 Tax=Treponema bryantii TaxID=163 RepID=A0A1H9CF45_9SPIR|nr:hypothetical protein [Treponema bryantii]SEP99779.1 hypothetical protein SAMN04487977_102155 [Treponema bryantii]